METIEYIHKAWCKSTCYPNVKDRWTKFNPSFGQCAVTSLLVQDLFGGFIYYNKKLNHYYNITNYGGLIDLTNKQFNISILYKHTCEVDRDDILYGKGSTDAKTLKRYKKLKQRYLFYKLKDKNELHFYFTN